MKLKFLPLLFLSLLFISVGQADEWLFLDDTPYDIDVVYREEAAPFIKHVEDEWEIYQFGKNSLRKIEQFTTTEVQTENFYLKFMFELDDLKPRIKSKINYRGKTVYLVFNFAE